MKKTTFVAGIQVRDDMDDLFLVKYIAVMDARDGRQYLNIVLADKTGELEAKKWNQAQEYFDKIKKGDFVRATGKINQYQNRIQFIISELTALDEAEAAALDPADFVLTSALSPDSMMNQLVQIVESLPDVYIKELLSLVLHDPEIGRRLKLWQAGKSIHHAYQGGLLEHVLSCAELAKSLSKHYSVNESYVVAGAVLHDLCKIYELTDGPNVEYTEEGKLVGHLVKSIELLDRFTYKVKNFPHLMKLHLKHILLSHHGEYEYGSPKIPQTTEAMLVHLIDLMDSKMNSFVMIKKMDSNVGHWSSYQKHLDRMVFKDELPTFTEPLCASEPMPEVLDCPPAQSAPKSLSPQSHNPRPYNKEIKNNAFASLLKDFKIES